MLEEATQHPEPADERDDVHVRRLPRRSPDRVLSVDDVVLSEPSEHVQVVADWRRVVDAGDLKGHRAIEAVADLDPKGVVGNDGTTDGDLFAEIRIRVFGNLVAARVAVVRWVWTDCSVPDEGAREGDEERDDEDRSVRWLQGFDVDHVTHTVWVGSSIAFLLEAFSSLGVWNETVIGIISVEGGWKICRRHSRGCNLRRVILLYS